MLYPARACIAKGAAMAILSVAINDHDEALITQLIESGQFRDPDEILREGLRLIEVQQREDSAREDAMRQAIQAGLDDLSQGKYIALSGGDQIAGYIQELGKRAAERLESAGV